MNRRISLEPAVLTAPSAVNHFYVVDVSGSMSSTLPKMRQHLKNRLALLVKPTDTVTIIYFSGKGQCGTVIESQVIDNLTDLSVVHQAIDRFMRPIGMTAFIDPVKLARDIAQSNYNGNPNRMTFMTDGYDNSYRSDDIVSEFLKTSEFFSSTTILEYGWYCNRELLTKISQTIGAAHIFSEDYTVLEPVIEQTFTQNAVLVREVTISGQSAVYLNTMGEMVIVNAVDGKVKIPSDINEIYVIDEQVQSYTEYDTQSLIINLFYAMTTMKTKMAWLVIFALGDRDLLNKFSNCFTKQDYSNLTQFVKAAYTSTDLIQRTAGLTIDQIDDMASVVDVLNILISGNNYLDIGHPEFKYSRIGKKTEQKEDTVVESLVEQMQSVSAADAKLIAQQIVDHEQFVPEFQPIGTSLKSLHNLVFNETRPNINLQTTQEGFVEIPLSKQKEFKLPGVFNTWITRNYNIVKDGIINTKTLPVVVDQESFDKLRAIGAIDNVVYDSSECYLIDLTKFPLLKYKDAVEQNAQQFFTKHVELQDLKAQQKVLKHLRDQLTDRGSASQYAAMYGDVAGQWLYSIGIRDYGFTPPVAAAEPANDVYMSRELSVKIKGLSSLPSISAVQAKIEKKSKLNIADIMISKWLVQYQDLLSKIGFDDAKKALLETETKHVIDKTRELQHQLNQVMYSILVGKVWFTGFDDMDNTSDTISYHGHDLQITAAVEEKPIKL